MTIAEMKFDNEKLLVLGWFINNFGSPFVGNIEDSIKRELFTFNVGENDYYTVEFTEKLFSISYARIKNVGSLFGSINVPEYIEPLATFRSLS